MTLKYLIQKEIIQLRRNSFMPKLILFLPITIICVFPWAVNEEVKNIHLSVVDYDHSSASEQLIQKIMSCDYFILENRLSSYSDAMKCIQNGTSDAILEIEKNFEKNILLGEKANVYIAANSVNGTRGNLTVAYLSQIIQNFSLDEQYVKNCGIKLSQRFLFNPTLDYKVYMIPTLMVIIMTLLTSFLPALNIIREKEKGTIEQINVTPVSRVEFVIGKLIPYWLIGFVTLNIAMLLTWILYGLKPAGNIFTIYLFTSMFIFQISGFGLVISNYSKTMQQAMFFMFFFMMIFILMNGMFTPVNSMPHWAQLLTMINPLQYLIDALRMIYLKGGTFMQLFQHFIIMTLFAIALNIWAVVSYKKNS